MDRKSKYLSSWLDRTTDPQPTPTQANADQKGDRSSDPEEIRTGEGDRISSQGTEMCSSEEKPKSAGEPPRLKESTGDQTAELSGQVENGPTW